MFDSVPECAAYFDCVTEVLCTAQPAQCETYRQALTGLYCYPPGTMVSAAQLAPGCQAAYDAYVQVYPACAQ